MAQEVVTLIDITRSSENKVFETTLFVKQYDRLKEQGKLGNWRLKSDIESIKTEIVEEAVTEETAVEIVQLDEEPTETGLDYKLMSLGELKAECKANGIKFHHASKEAKLIALLEA